MGNISWMSDELRKRAYFVTIHEAAWEIADIPRIVAEACQNNRIILGGDILDKNMDPTYDNWYYEADDSKDLEYNVLQSCRQMTSYLNRYTSKNGRDLYIVIVFKGA